MGDEVAIVDGEAAAPQRRAGVLGETPQLALAGGHPQPQHPGVATGSECAQSPEGDVEGRRRSDHRSHGIEGTAGLGLVNVAEEVKAEV